MFPIQCKIKIKNQPSNSTSCSDNALRFLVSYGGQNMLRTSNDLYIFNSGLRFEGLRYILKSQITSERHWTSTWTLLVASCIGVGGTSLGTPLGTSLSLSLSANLIKRRPTLSSRKRKRKPEKQAQPSPRLLCFSTHFVTYSVMTGGELHWGFHGGGGRFAFWEREKAACWIRDILFMRRREGERKRKREGIIAYGCTIHLFMQHKVHK